MLANDLGGFKAKYMLVGVLTWAVPKEIKGVIEEVEEGPLEEDAPRIEAREDVRGQEDEIEEEVELGVDPGIEEEGRQEVQEVQEVQEGEKAEEKGEEKQEFEIRTYRMAAPMTSKKAEEVTKVIMEFILKLRMDGYYVNRIHTDQGHEFMGYFKKWIVQRGISLTKTPGDDPTSNGRAEVAVQSLKSQVRRTLRQAQVVRVVALGFEVCE